MTTATTTQTNRTKETAGAESELRAAARRRGLTMKELAALMGVSAGYLSQIANGGRPWTPKMREKAAAVLGEVPGQGTVYRQGGVVNGESSFIRERARTLGMTMQDLADRAGVSYGYMTDVSRGRRHMGVKVQARVESVLQAPAKVAPAQCVNRQGEVVSGESSYIRERARELGMTMKDLAERTGVSYSYMTQVARGRKRMGVKMQARVESVLQAPAKIAPAKCANRQGGVVNGESSFIRERARTLGMTMQDLADRVGVSYGYMTDVSRGRRHMGVKVQARVESVLQAPAKVAPAQCVNRQGEVVSGESSYIRERARELGMTMKDLAERTGVSYSYMTQVARGRKRMGVKMQARVESVLQAPAKIAPAKCANRQGEVVSGESSYIRERARELGMTMQDLADRVGVSYGYMSMVARGRGSMGVKVQARIASVLEAPVKVAPAQPASIDREAMWGRMDAHGFSQNEVARRAGISSANLSQIMNGRNNPSPGVLKRLHGVLFQPTSAERVMPAEVKVLGWRKGERSGMVVRGAGGPGRGAKSGGGSIRVGGRVPWGAKAEYAYRAGYDGMGRVSVTHVVERGYSAMLKQPETVAA